MCQSIGRSPIGTSGFGIPSVSSLRRPPRPPQKMTTGMSCGLLACTFFFMNCEYTPRDIEALYYPLGYPSVVVFKPDDVILVEIPHRNLHDNSTAAGFEPVNIFSVRVKKFPFPEGDAGRIPALFL